MTDSRQQTVHQKRTRKAYKHSCRDDEVVEVMIMQSRLGLCRLDDIWFLHTIRVYLLLRFVCQD